MRLFVSLTLLLFAAAPAVAAETPWQEVTPSVRLRVISSDTKAADGSTLVGLELDMPQSFHTYWQDPGESGIATRFDIAGSQGLSDASIEWPYPSPEVTGGFLDYVYDGPTVLPIKLEATGETAQLDATVVMGVCSDVCVPVQAKFSLPLSFGAADPVQSLRLQQAQAAAPIDWKDGAVPFGPVSYDPKAKGLRVTLASHKVDPTSVIALTSDPTVIFDAPQKSPDGRSLLLPLRGQARGTEWTRNPVELTFMTPDGAYQVSERVAQPS
jgi:DsbC/DsbD-like thiol-disulfide interchange protein